MFSLNEFNKESVSRNSLLKNLFSLKHSNLTPPIKIPNPNLTLTLTLTPNQKCSLEESFSLGNL